MTASGSLRARLLGSLFAVIVIGALIQGGVAYRTALSEADQLFDYNMRQMALSMRFGNPLATLPTPPDGTAGLQGIDFVVQIWTGDGVRLFESSPDLVLPQRAVLGFSNVRAGRAEYRVYSLATASRVIQVAQDLAIRKRLAGGLALKTVGPIGLMMPLLMLVTWWVVTRSLAPVARVREQVARRAADDLSPVEVLGLPDEVRPVIVELNALLGRLRAAFEAQTHFVADAAHELRSPLAALRLQLETLRRAGDDDARQLATARLDAGIARASRLVEQLLVLAREQDAGSGSGAGQPVDLVDLARQAIVLQTPQAQERQIDLGLSGATGPVPVAGQGDALAILLRNLVGNALKYTPAGGTVDVDVAVLSGGAVQLAIEDSGPGIAPSDRERVLDRFYRASQQDGSVAGSGLGLAIVKAISDRHHAVLVLDDSPRLGGLRVRLTFEAATPA